MTKTFSTCSLFFAALLFAFYTFVSQAQVICQSNGHNSSCVTSDYCSTEHTLISEDIQCSSHSSPSSDTPLIPGLEICPFDPDTGDYRRCPNSRVNNRKQSVGNYGKPNWVGAEFQSISYDIFSMMVMWEHTDAETLKSLRDLSPPQGYEVRIYQKQPGSSEVLRHCFCVTDPSMRNISDIRSTWFEYDERSHMIVEVQSFPSFIDDNENNNKRRNCSLLTGCATNKEEECIISHDDCYSWPQSCLNFLPPYDPETCAPPLYSRPGIVKAEMTLIDGSAPDSDVGKLNLSWEPPVMDYDLFPVPDTYYVTIESDYNTFIFKVVNSTNISILSLNYTMVYTVFITPYVPCSGLSHPTNGKSVHDVGCGNQSRIIVRLVPPTTTTTTLVPTTTTTLVPTTTTTMTTIQLTPTSVLVATVVVGALSAAVIMICMFIALIILRRRCIHTHKTKSGMPTLCINIDIGPQPKRNTNISVFVFYPKNIGREDEAFIQTYLVAALSEHAEIKAVKSPDDPYFERGSIPESIDRNLRQADFVLIVCNSLFLSEWNCDQCSPSVQLLKRYMGNVSIRSDNSISKLITVILDERKKELLSHSRLNLGNLRSFMVTESTWESEVEKIVHYMTRTSVFQIATQEHSLDALEALKSPDSPVSDTIPDSSQESHTATPRTSDSSLSDTNGDHLNNIACAHDGEVV